MSFLDKIVSAVAPPESAQERADAHSNARSLATPGDWLSAALDHHEDIDTAFDAARSASTPQQAKDAVRALGGLLTGHSIAEEAVLYPALAMHGHKMNAAEAYQEQQTAKVEMAELEQLEPLSEEWVDQLEHIRGAVQHHVYEEESEWFPKIVDDVPPNDQAFLTKRFTEEYDRYMAGV